MKVIKKGRPQRGWSKELDCTGEGNRGGGCGAKLLVEFADLFQTTSNARDETTFYVTFECPDCGVLTDLEETDHPSVPSGGLRRRNPGPRSDGVR